MRLRIRGVPPRSWAMPSADVPLTVHPGIGYDIISNHPLFNGAALSRQAGLDFATFGGSVEGLDNGVVLSVGSAIMGPQVFEKNISCVSNLRLRQPRNCPRPQFTWGYSGWRRLGWTQGEQDNRLLPALLQKLRPYGWLSCLCPVRQYRFHASLAE